MEISAIKHQLTMAQVLAYYGLKTDKHNRIHCPFHKDKTPSMQIYPKTQTAYCFSSNCKTSGKSMDVIDFIMHKENSTKAEAIHKAKAMLGYIAPYKPHQMMDNQEKAETQAHTTTGFLEQLHHYFCHAVSKSTPAKTYLAQRSLDYKTLAQQGIPVGYNSGQFHHGTRKSEKLIQECLAHGLLLDKNLTSRTGEKAYGVFGKNCLSFALRDQDHHVTGFYFRSIMDHKDARHFYLKNRKGLYPHYPDKNTKKLILTESIIDAASLFQNKAITKTYSILACYGTNGLTEEHQRAIQELPQLEEIIFCFDMDEAGKIATTKYAQQLKTENPTLQLTTLELPNKDVNETLQGHESSILIEILNKRKEISSSFSISTEEENQSFSNNRTEHFFSIEEKPVEKPQSPSTSRSNALAFLKDKNLLKNLNAQIGKAGIIGEDNSRMLLFLIIISYLNKNPLHALVQGSSGSGKTHIISRIADLMPQEDVLRFTRITESSLYNWGEYDLYQKVVIIEDLDGLKEDALYALREFISNQVLRSSVTIKDKKGNNKSSHKIVKGQFSSLSATTKGETYEDNMSRSFLLAIDESQGQTQRIIDYQNKRNAGEIDQSESKKSIHFIQQVVRNLHHYEVINPYATKLNLPEKVHKIRRLNEMYQSVIKQVTFLNQYQRKLTKDDQLITEIKDIEQATEILFESIILKVDELDGSLRQFFEKLKKYLIHKSGHKSHSDTEFTQRAIRQSMNISKSQCSRFFIQLVELEYIAVKNSGNLRRQQYVIDYWDNHERLRIDIKNYLLAQIEHLKEEKEKNTPNSMKKTQPLLGQ